jgi:hypothetical protein
VVKGNQVGNEESVSIVCPYLSLLAITHMKLQVRYEVRVVSYAVYLGLVGMFFLNEQEIISTQHRILSHF